MTKKIILLILIVVTYLIIMGLIFGFNTIINNQNYIIVGNSVIFEYKNKTWNYIKDFNTINGRKYFTYINKIDYGITKLQYYKSTIYSYKDNTPINYDNILAYSGKRNVGPIEYQIKTLDSNDYNIICNHLDIEYRENIYGNKVILDFDKDGINETLYSATSTDINKSFSIIFIYDDEIIDVEKYIYNNFNIRYLYLYDIIDIRKDGNLEIITKSSLTNNIDTCYLMYEYKNNIKQISSGC